MASVHDVARYILQQQGEMDTWKLEKLVYYCQAWHLVWDEKKLFDERIEAWANGPVAPALFAEHRGEYKKAAWPRGSVANLTKAERESIDAVLKRYGKLTGFSLRELTHREPPWRDARRGVAPGVSSHNEITTDSMGAYYGSL